jgi:hypothetical protein
MAMAANKGLVSVRFVAPWKSYYCGDIAGFLPNVAKNLVNSGTATYHKVEKPAQTTVTKAPVLAPQPKKKVSKKKTKKKKPVNPVIHTPPFGGPLDEPVPVDPEITDASDLSITMKE